jgi:hypothetical protein
VCAAPAVAEALGALSRAFARAPLRWYVFGAQAVLAYGRPRLTADLDATVDAGPERAAELQALLAPEGVELRAPLPPGFVERTRVLPLWHQASGLPIDLVLAGPGLEQEMLANARPLALGGVTVPVISPEDLVVVKILAGRPKDLEDAAGVLELQLPHLDVERCRRLLGLLEEALGRSDLRHELQRLVTRARGHAPS